MKNVFASCGASAVGALRGRAAVWAAVLTVGLSAAPGALFAQDPMISTEVSARGRREHLIRADEWGRYAVEAKSGEGAAVEVVDKLRGVIARCEADVEKDGRLDLFLEAGEYKIFTEGPRKAQGNVRLEVTKFAPFDSAGEGGRAGGGKNRYGYLAPFGQVSTRLVDKEARGWWIFVPRDTTVYIEAMGRRLNGLAVFRGGERLVASAGMGGESSSSSEFVNGSVPGKPLFGLRVVKRLERGKYLVFAYGGGRDKYTTSDSESPLYVQWMLRSIEPGKPIAGKIGASGVNRFTARQSADIAYVVVESPKMQKLAVRPGAVTAGGVSERYADTLYAKPQSGCCQAKTIDVSGQETLISVSGAPGTEFRITPANRSGRYSYDYSPAADGAYQLSALYTSAAGDNVGISGALIDLKDASIVALKADTASPSRPLRRTFNIVGSQPLSALVWISEAGTYTLSPESGVRYQWRVKRFYASPPRNYSPPDWASGRGNASLSQGLHEIEIMPWGAKGGAEFSFYSGRNAARQSESAAAKTTLGPFDLKKGRDYRFYFNAIPMELASVIIDKYPPPAKESVADAYLTGAAADKADSASARASQTQELALGAPRYATLGRRGSADYRFKIKEAGIYRMETTGRLHTKVTLRDRFGGLSKSQSGNGVGRNALVTEFFLPGDYIAEVEAVGESAGRLGVLLSKGELRKGGTLQDGVDKRAAVRANSAVVYDFKADKKALYRFESFGAAGGEEIRLEDADGWPLVRHGSEAPQEALLEKGAYKLYSLPCPYENYRVTRFDAVKDPPKFTGPGPHGITVNEPATATWMESGSPARFLFDVSAAISAGISLTPDFKGTLKQRDSKDAPPVAINGRYDGVLQKGKYEISVTPAKPQNYSPYQLRVETADLFAGIGYHVDKDETLSVQVGERGRYEIFSQGRGEVAARLCTGDGKTEIARSGGDQLDWNFFISERLDSGSYRLRLTGFESNPAKVFMRRAVDTALSLVKLDGASAEKRNVALSWKQIVIPVVSSSGDVLSVSASAGSRFVCEFEPADRQTAEKLGAAAARNGWTTARRRGRRVNISAAVEKGAAYTLRIWSEDRIDDVAAIDIRAAEAIPLSFEDAKNGVSGQAPQGDAAVFYRIDGADAGPGHYELITSENEATRVSAMNAPEDDAVKKGQPWTDIIRTPGESAPSGVFEEEEGLMIASAGRRLFIGAAFKSPGKFRFALAPVFLAAPREELQVKSSAKPRAPKSPRAEREELPVVIKHGGDKAFAIDAPPSTFATATLTMPAGQPVIGLSSPPQSAEFLRNGVHVAGGQYIAPGVSMTAVLPGDTGRVVGWNAQAGGAAAAGAAAVFSIERRTLEKADTLTAGRTAWTAKQALAKEYRLPGTPAAPTVALKLSPRAGAAYISPDGRRDLYYGGDDGALFTITPAGGRLFLFGKDDGGVEIELYAAPQTKKTDAPKTAMTAGSESVKIQPADAYEAIRVKNGAKQPLRLFRSGAVASIDWINKSGVMTQNLADGAKLAGESGVLLVSYNSGAGKIKLCRDDGGASALNACLWGEPAGKKDDAPAIKEISRTTLAHGVNLYTVELSEPAHVSISAPAPAAAMVSTADKIGAYKEFWEALRWDVPLPAGKHTVGVKPLTGGSLLGIPLTVGIYPVLRLTEGCPLRTQLMAAQNRLAKFDLQRDSRIGIGLSSQGQTVEAALLDAKGKELASGAQIFKELTKGAYYVLLSMPQGSIQNGVSATVRLFGQDNPPADPPDERIRRIIKDDRDENQDARASRQ